MSSKVRSANIAGPISRAKIILKRRLAALAIFAETNKMAAGPINDCSLKSRRNDFIEGLAAVLIYASITENREFSLKGAGLLLEIVQSKSAVTEERLAADRMSSSLGRRI